MRRAFVLALWTLTLDLALELPNIQLHPCGRFCLVCAEAACSVWPTVVHWLGTIKREQRYKKSQKWKARFKFLCQMGKLQPQKVIFLSLKE
jgi:hypothetical protein